MKTQYVDGTAIHSDNTIRVGTGIHGRGTITMEHKAANPEKSMCHGCYDDFYNGEGAQECWAFKTARVVNKVGYSSIHCANGPDTKMVKTFSCWHGVRK